MPRFSREYLRHMQSPEWRQFRERVKARDRSRCVQCGSCRFLEVDHLHYRTLGHERLEDCQTLCRRCHARKTRRDRRARRGARGRLPLGLRVLLFLGALVALVYLLSQS